MLLLGIDLETTGTDPTLHHVVEVGAILYNTETKREVQSFSTLVVPSENWIIPPLISHLTGIHSLDVLDLGMSSSGAWSFIAKMASKAEAWCAHNASFEKSFIPEGHILNEMACFDTMLDIPYPDYVRHRDLERLSLSHGFPNMNAHKALPDVQAMFNVLSCYEWADVEAYWHSPSNYFECVAKGRTFLPFELKDEAKSLGLQWDGANKKWGANLRQMEYESLTKRIEDEDLNVELLIA
jgi:hypothetical protein